MNLLRLVLILSVIATTGCGIPGLPPTKAAPPLGQAPASPTGSTASSPTTTPVGGGLPGANPAGESGLMMGFPVLEAMTNETAKLPLEFKMSKPHETIHVDVLLDTRKAPLMGLEPTLGTSMTYTQERIANDPRFDTRVKIEISMPKNAAGAQGVFVWFKLQTGTKLEAIGLSPQRPVEPGRESHFDLLLDGGLQVTSTTRPPLTAPKRIRGSIPGFEF